MLHFTMSGNEIVEKYWETKIMKLVNRMKNTNYYDNHDHSNYRCLGVALCENGELLGFTNSLNPYQQGIVLGSYITLKEIPVRANPLVSIEDIGWKTYIENYNKGLLYNIDSLGNHAIVAYYIFDQYDDEISNGEVSNKTFDDAPDIDSAFDELSKIRENFKNSHNARMQELNDAIKSLNKTMKSVDESNDEITRTLDETGKRLDALLNSL